MKNPVRVLHFFWPDTPRILLVLVLLVLSTGANLLKPWPLALIVDSLLGSKPLPGWMIPWVAGWDKPMLLTGFSLAILLLHTLHAALSTAQTYGLIKVGLRGLARVRNELFHWLQRLSLRYHQGARQGDIIYRAAWDTYAFQTLFQHGLFAFVAASLSLSFMVWVMWQLNQPLTLLALGTVPWLVIAMRILGRNMSQHSLNAHQADSRVTSQVQQSIVALPLIQSYTREAEEEQRFGALVALAVRERLSQHGWEVLYLGVIAIMFGLGISLIAWLGAMQVWMGSLSIGQLLIFLAYLGQFYEPLNQLSRMGATVADASAGTRRVFEILDAPEEVKEGSHPRPVVNRRAEDREPREEEGGKRAGDGKGQVHGPATPQPLDAQGAISFVAVSFGYLKERGVLREISFEIAAGQSVALIGPSGAGKTTLLHLLPRFFDPATGSVRLDGVDLRELSLKDLRAQIAMVMQEPILLPATIAENIAYGRPEATPAQIEAAAQAAHADGFIRQLPGQYQTVVGEAAARLSAGEKQRINMARAFLKDAPILVLDEPTSALDTESEALFNSSLRELRQGRTTFIATHRLDAIGQADQILVLEEGRLTEFGPPAELRQRGGYFARIMGGAGGRGG